MSVKTYTKIKGYTKLLFLIISNLLGALGLVNKLPYLSMRYQAGIGVGVSVLSMILAFQDKTFATLDLIWAASHAPADVSASPVALPVLPVAPV